MIIKVFAIGATVVALAGCASMADSFDQMSGVGGVTRETSAFDGTTAIDMAPAFLFGNASDLTGSPIKLGAHWSSKTPASVDLVLSYSTSTVAGAIYTNFAGMDVNLDGQISQYRVNGFTQHSNEGYNTSGGLVYTGSENAVTVPLSTLERMIASEDCRLRIQTGDGYVDANLSIERSTAGQAAARLRLREFLAEVKR